jgi:hypothetical protein
MARKTAGKAAKTPAKAPPKDALLQTLQSRFEKHMSRHQGVAWVEVQRRLEANATALASLGEMERTGGEPDVVGGAQADGAFVFYDCAPESPTGRRSVCYDRQALNERKEHKPKTSALDLAGAMGIKLLTEAQYRELQRHGEFDTTTSSWVATPQEIRDRGGALYCDRRYGHVFLYHNGAQSYYAARGFRGSLRV